MGSRRTYLVIFVLVSLIATATASTRKRQSRAKRTTTAQNGRRATKARTVKRAPRKARVKRATTRDTGRASRRRRRIHRLVWNPMFRGSHEMLVRHNLQLDQLELPRIVNDEQLLELELAQELVPVEDSESLTIASNLAENRRYCRPWTRDFLEDLGEAYYNEFRKPIVVTSLVRTIEQQKKLRRTNRNAAPQEGDTASTHLTGVTVDILKRGMTRKQHDWLNHYLLPLKQAGLVDPIEERRQPVFHIVVFNTYSEEPAGGDESTPPDPLTVASSD